MKQLLSLSDKEVLEQRKIFGLNFLTKNHEKSTTKIFLNQFVNPLSILLIIAGLLIFFTNNKTDSIIIIVIIIINSLLGSFQELKAKKLIRRLKGFIQKYKVIRNNLEIEVPLQELVPKDLLIISKGMLIPADAKIIKSNSIIVDQSIITNQQKPKLKSILQDSILYQGSYVLKGTAIAEVINIGKNTKLNKLGRSIGSFSDQMPICKDIKQLTNFIISIIVVSCLCLLLIGFLYNKNIKELLIIIIALFVALVPEGLPILLTIILIKGAINYAKNGVIVKNIESAESLNRIDIIIIEEETDITQENLDDINKLNIRLIVLTNKSINESYLIAKKLFIKASKETVITSKYFNNAKNEAKIKILQQSQIFALFSAHEKYELIKNLQNIDLNILITGKNIDDAASLKQADIGIAIGNADDIAKDSADIVIEKNDFNKIIKAIKDSGKIFYSIKIVITYFFSGNIGEMVLIVFLVFTKNNMLLSAAQILWLNFITDGLLNIALASEPFDEQKNIFYEKLITKKDLINFFLLGLVMATGSIIIFLINKENNIIYRQNLTFLTFAAFQWFNAYSCRSLDKSVFKLKLLDNKKLLYSIAVTIILQIFITYSKIGQHIFNTMPLRLTDWIIAIFMASTVLIAFEILKFYRRFDEKQSE